LEDIKLDILKLEDLKLEDIKLDILVPASCIDGACSCPEVDDGDALAARSQEALKLTEAAH